MMAFYKILFFLSLLLTQVFAASIPTSEVNNLKAELMQLEVIANKGEEPSSSYDFILIDFWASWCDPCKESFPYYEKLILENKKKKIKFIAVNLDDDKESAEKFLKEFPTKFVTYWDKKKNFQKKFNFESIPYMVILNSKWEMITTVNGFNVKTKAKVKKLLQN